MLPAEAMTRSAPTCPKRQLLHTSYDRDDAVVRIEVYQDGKLVRTFRGRHLGRTVSLTHLSAVPHLAIKVVFRLVDRQRIVLRRTYSRCHAGALHRHTIKPVATEPAEALG